MEISKKCLEFVKKFEGFYSKPYRCPAGVKTLGYGMTGKEIQGLTSVTEQQASEMLEKLLNEKYALPIKRDLDKKGVKLKQNEFDSLVSFAYNCGVSGLFSSTLYKNVVRGIRDKDIITENFSRWNKGGGKVLAGLVRRRKEEAEMFLEDINLNILELQKFLNLQGFKDDRNKVLVEDGIIGTRTREAFKKMKEVEI